MKANKTIIAVLLTLWLMLGCGTIKSWFSEGDEKVDEGLNIPHPSEVSKNPDGSLNLTEEQLSPSKKIHWVKWILLFGFLTTSGLIVRNVVKNKTK